MGRFLLTLGTGLVLFLAVAWYFDLFVHSKEGDVTGPDAAQKRETQLGSLLYPAKPLAAEPSVPDKGNAAEPIPVAAHFVVQDKTDTGGQIDGQVLFVGEAVPDAVVALSGVAPFAAEPYQYALINQGGQDLIMIYRRLRENAKITKHQMLALLDPAKAMNEVAIKKAKVEVAREEFKGAAMTQREAEARYEAARKLFERNPPLIAAEEYREKKLAKEKFATEAEAKKAAIEMAAKEADSAVITLKQHFIRNPIEKGFIKTIYHNRGDSVKNQDPIFQLYSTQRLQAEGTVEVQHVHRLYPGMPVIVEPGYEDGPFRTFKGHRLEVNGVAVNRDSKLFVSVSEDRTGLVWVKEAQAPKWLLQHSDPVRSVVCSPPGCKQNWCLTGCANGSIYLWDLDQPARGPVKVIADAHRGPVTALAVSPDGTYFASGGEDNMVQVWRTGEDKALYAVDDHAPTGPVSSLAFTPQSRLVSASKDNTLRVWELHEKGARVLGEPIGGRDGKVNQLGVSQDGRWMLFDQGKTLHLLSVTDGRTVELLENRGGGMSFETLALFSPDGSLMLTGGGQEGRLQLWRTPTSFTRGHEVRQFVSEDKSVVTCAAFAPDAGLAAKGIASFAISGSKDGAVYLWPVPSKEAVEHSRIHNAKLDMLGWTVEAGTRNVRVGVQLDNPDGRFMDGRPVTIVIEP